MCIFLSQSSDLILSLQKKLVVYGKSHVYSVHVVVQMTSHFHSEGGCEKIVKKSKYFWHSTHTRNHSSATPVDYYGGDKTSL